jgi:hypothetical protein
LPPGDFRKGFNLQKLLETTEKYATRLPEVATHIQESKLMLKRELTGKQNRKKTAFSLKL